MQSMGPEQLFRLALNSVDSDLDVTAIAQQGADFEKRINGLVSANPNLTTGVLVGAAVAATAVAAYKAYEAMEKRIDQVDNERENYQDMIDQKISTYFMPQDRSKRSPWDLYLAEFIQKLRDIRHPSLNDLLWRYAGIHQKSIENEKRKGTVYAVMSTFSTPLGTYFPHTADDADALTQARKSLNILIAGELKEVLSEVESKLDSNWLTNMALFTEAERYLPWLNASRFMLISMGNIASNLLFAMNPNTDMPLSYENSAELCSLFRTLLGEMSSASGNKFHTHHKFLCCHALFEDFLSTLNSRTLVLKKSYEQNAETKLNLNEVSHSVHLMLQQLNSSLRGLIYLNHPLSEPAHLIGKVINLADLIYFHPKLVSQLVAKLQLPKTINYAEMMVNNPPTTVMDLLILWSDATHSVRSSALSSMPQTHEWQVQFVKTLRAVKHHFIKPIETATTSAQPFSISLQTNTTPSPARLFFISSIALLMEVYRIELSEPQVVVGAQSVSAQIRAINSQAMLKDARYGLDKIFALRIKDAKTHQALIEMFKRLYEILPLSKHLDLLALFRQNNQSTADTVEFRAVILRRLKALHAKYKQLLKAIENVIDEAESEKNTDIALSNILTSLNHTNPKTALSIPQITSEFEKQVTHSIEMLESSTYDHFLEEKEHALIDLMEVVDDVSLFESKQESEAFYAALRAGIRSQTLTSMSQKISESSVSFQVIMNNSTQVPTNKTSTDNKNLDEKDNPNIVKTGQDQLRPIQTEKTSYAFQWRALSTWLSHISLALFLFGLFMVLLMTLGSQSIPVIAAMSAPVASGLFIGGLVSAAAGGFGLAASYYTPTLFKPERKSNSLEPEKTELQNT